ncbi:MAG: hypothetical protein IJD39_09055 [Clostridia bacterium]|nr:hypothetical protein [Clostridia bacterium]
MKKIFALALTICLCLNPIISLAAINADAEFRSASITLTTNKLVVYSAMLNEPKESISVVSANLYREVAPDEWEFVCSLPVPSHVAHNASSYGSYVDCSAYIGTGNYRVTATYDADGYQITRNSNERSF